MRANAKYRKQYEELIRVSSANNLERLTATLYLMYAVGTPLRERTYLRLTNRSPGYRDESAVIIRKNWTVPNIRKFLKTVLQIAPTATFGINGSIWSVPLGKQTGPFNTQFNEFICNRLYVNNGSANTKLPVIDANHPVERIRKTLELLTIENHNV